MNILEEILERIKEINNYISNLYKDYNFSSYSGSNLEAHVNREEKQYESIKTEYANYQPFYSRGNFLFKAIESTDNIILEMYALLAGKYDKLKCFDCAWQNKLESFKTLYLKFKSMNVMGNEFYRKELQEIAESLEQSSAPKKYKRKIQKLAKKITKKSIVKRIIKVIKGRTNDKRQGKHSNS
ncbi:MAG: hypothetical protein KKA65_04030 [Nanoarchaeota archaeon]|nr:hypothetical protein [Nanoarchaeota archaeon]MBU4242125.1 hypothetical protein [Nanoarchaeota archaeon]MBU4352243.1 hypothetical protein [Nanoarchaeota archaeon]MBU4456646.1 hypothetical protein [Nanoarchaeota archaeon]MCG2719682.1 hypothetical protein [Nanoarchaeota archaeon]